MDGGASMQMHELWPEKPSGFVVLLNCQYILFQATKNRQPTCMISSQNQIQFQNIYQEPWKNWLL